MTHSYEAWLLHSWCESFLRDMPHGFDTFCASLYGWHYLKLLIYVIHDSLTTDMTNSDITPSHETCLNEVWFDAFIYDMTNRFLTFCAHGWHYLPVTWLIHMRQDFLTWNLISWGIMWLTEYTVESTVQAAKEWQQQLRLGQAVSCNSNWWWCEKVIFEAVERNRYFHWQFCVISDPCV